jgi:hypothetical protein
VRRHVTHQNQVLPICCPTVLPNMAPTIPSPVPLSIASLTSSSPASSAIPYEIREKDELILLCRRGVSGMSTREKVDELRRNGERNWGAPASEMRRSPGVGGSEAMAEPEGSGRVGEGRA